MERPCRTLLLAAALSVLAMAGSVVACRPQDPVPKFKIGDRAHVCVVLNGRLRSVFTPRVDDMSRLELTQSYTDERVVHANVSSPTVSVSASTTSADYSSVQKLYVVGSRVLPVYTAVIHVTGGEIEGITWDDGCFFCDGSDPNTCLHTSVVNGTVLTAGNFAGRSCSEPRTLCEDSPRECDLKVYLVWTGTDVSGRYLKSAGMRFSRFQQYDAKSLYDSARTQIVTQVQNV